MLVAARTILQRSVHSRDYRLTRKAAGSTVGGSSHRQFKVILGMDASDYRELFDWAGDAMLIVCRGLDNTYRILDTNRAWENLVGRRRTEFCELPLERAFPRSIAERLACACDQCLVLRGRLDLTIHLPLLTGVSEQSWTLLPASDPDASIQRVEVVARELAQYPRSSVDRETLSATLEQISDAISQFDRHGRIVFVSNALSTFTELESDLIGKTAIEVYPDNANAAESHAAVMRALQTGEIQEVEIRFARTDGKEIWLQTRYAPIRGADGAVDSVVSVGRDISALKQVEMKLRQSERQFRTLAENSPDCILRFDLDSRLIYANPQLERFTGIPVEQLLNKLAVDRLQQQEIDATPIAMSVRSTLQRVRRERISCQMEIGDLNAHAGSHSNCYTFIFVPEMDGTGEVESILAIGRDITHLKSVEADLRALNATLEQRVRARTSELEAANRDLQSFAHTASHDLRTPLRAIVGLSSLLLESEAGRLSPHGSELLERIQAAGLKLNRLIDDILDYSRAGQADLTRRSVALGQIAREVAAELLVEYQGASVTIAELPSVNGDATMLRQVLQNLIGNALKFSRLRSPPTVEVNWLKQGEGVVFYVRDNGAGFDMRHVEKLGTMFCRLHSEREFAGSGVGLAIVQRLIERHGGRLWARSEVDAGATFFFTVPSGATVSPS